MMRMDPSEESGQRTFSRKLAVFIGSAALLSSLAFILCHNSPVFDDVGNGHDASFYASEGITVQAIRQQTNPTGPGSFVWIGLFSRWLGDGLQVQRLAVWLSWFILLVGSIFLIETPPLWAAFALCWIFPHSVMASGLVLTEGPALCLAFLGSLLFINALSTTGRLHTQLKFWISLLLMGLSVICRQYYLGLIPAAMMTLLLVSWRRQAHSIPFWALILSAIVISSPVASLVALWGGISSASARSGALYKYTANVGLSWDRPLIAFLYVCLYLLAFTWPNLFRKTKWSLAVAFVAMLSSVAFAKLRHGDLLEEGPIRQSLTTVFHGGALLPVATLLLAAVALYNAGNYIILNFSNLRELFLKQPVFCLGSLFLFFFVAEQIGVGGTIPFYERYLLQIGPFLGMVVFAAEKRLLKSHLATAVVMALLAQGMLWRFAF